MAEETGKRAAGMDPLKAYCLVLGFLVLVLGGLFVYLDGQRSDYAKANTRAEAYLRGRESPAADRPSTIPALAFDVEKYARTYQEMRRQGGEFTPGVPAQMMQNLASKVEMTQTAARAEHVERTQRGYETRYQEFDYDKATLAQLLALVYNIESRGRYRVSRINWRLDERENAALPAGQPLHRIEKSTIRVAVRTPAARER